MKTLLLLSVAFFTVQASITEEWLSFKEQYGKIYRNREEEKIRYNIFQKNLQKIEAHNKNFNDGKSSFKMAVNKFADLTTDEFKKIFGYNHGSKSYLGTKKQYLAFKSDPEPGSLDWRDKGAVTEVKDQSVCGAALAFSITGAIESQNFIKTGNLISLSASMLADCACCTIPDEHLMSLHQQTEINCTNFDTCSSSLGGWQDIALEWSKKYGLMADKDYPYTECDGECHFNKSMVVTKISSYVNVAQNDENELKKAVAITPTSVVIDVTENFQFYISGIFDDKICSGNNLNHGVLIVGYGSLNGNDYWIVKNSWGSAWGDQGYILMSRNKSNQCGIASDAVYPLI